MKYECLACAREFNSDVKDRCPSCEELVWWEKRSNIILLLNFLEEKNIPHETRDVLFSPQVYQPYWEIIINE